MQLEGYSDLSELTRGGMATVYRARQDSLDRTVAIKFLSAGLLWDDQSREFFDRESLVIARLNHPNIIKVIDRGMTPANRPYFVMEYVQGRDLEQITREVRLSMNARIHVVMQICRAVAFAHKNGVVHRDIKPGNILIDKHGHVYILDFGIAWLESSGRPQHEEVVGTPDYMSPEQFSDPASVTTLSDIYSLGAVMYKLFGDSVPSQHFADLGVPLKALPEELAGLILQCLEMDPAARPQSASEVGFRLLKMLRGAHIRDRERAEARITMGNAADKFQLLDVINRNRWGAVYLFEDKQRRNLLVVKKRVGSHAGLRQARELKQIRHPNLINIVGTSRKSDTFIVVTEYQTGGSLQERLSRPCSRLAFLRVAREVCAALQTAHAHNLVHGNLRPSNILIDSRGRCRVTDFGFSRHYRDATKLDWYQPRTRADASIQRDIYSAGAIFYHMLTGTPATVRFSLLVVDKAFESVEPDLQQLVRRMIEMQSMDRFQNFTEVLEALRRIDPASGAEDQHRKPWLTGWRRWAIVGGGLGLLGSVAAYFLLF